MVGMAYDEEESHTSAHYRVQLILSVADAFVSGDDKPSVSSNLRQPDVIRRVVGEMVIMSFDMNTCV